MDSMYMYTGTMGDAQIKTEPFDTFDTDDTLGYYNTGDVKPGPAFMASSPQAEQRFVKNIQPKKKISSAFVDVKSIRGLPVNKPFKIKYSSSVVGSVESKVYIIVEYSEVGVTPIMIDVEGVREMPCERFNSNVLQAHSKSRHVAVPNKEGFNDSFPVDGHGTKTKTRESDTNPDILNEIIDEVVKQDTRMGKKRQGSRDLMTSIKKHKVIKLESSTDKNVPHSAIIRSNVNRIKHADLNKLKSAKDTSDLDDVLEEYRGVNDNLEGIENETSNSMFQFKKNEDPDFLPVAIKGGKPRVLIASSNGDVNEYKLKGPREDKNTERQIENSMEENDVKRRDSLKKCQRKKKERQTVTLSEHPEKYYIEDQVSVQMKDRGKSDLEKTSKLMVCTECHKFRTEDQSLMETHLGHHLNGDLSCKNCEFIAASITEIRRHTNEHHISMKKKNIFCLICAEGFVEQQLYRNHLKAVHNLLPYLCSICSTKDSPVTFRTAQIYKEHYVEKHKEHMYQCSYCGLYQFNMVLLRKHVCAGRSELDTAVPCDICGKEIRPKCLKKHKNTVHFNVRAFPCPECKYAARDAIKLQQHIQAKHEGIRNLKCDQCDFTCVRPYQLDSHRKTHTGYKPYRCDLCPYAAAWNVQLKDHKKLHENALGKECERCGILIRTGAPFTKHMRKEHNAGEEQQRRYTTSPPGPPDEYIPHHKHYRYHDWANSTQ